MVWKAPEQSPGYGEQRTFANYVKEHLAKNGWTQKDLAEAANLSESMVCRMLRDNNGRGSPFRLTDELVTTVALALKLGRAGWEELLYLAFPERRLWLEAIDRRENVISLNCRLYENGLPTLGMNNPEN